MEALKELWVDKGQEHHLLQSLDVMLQAPYLIKADRWVHLHPQCDQNVKFEGSPCRGPSVPHVTRVLNLKVHLEEL